MHISELCRQAHQRAKDKGFWGCKAHSAFKKCKTIPGNSCLPCPENFIRRNLSELLMLIVTELSEACEALRHNKRQKGVVTKDGFKLRNKWRKDTFEDELADAVIRICDLAESEGIDLEWQIKKKLEYNKSRPSKHGKEF